MEKEGRRKGRERAGEREERGAAQALAVLTHLGEGLFLLDEGLFTLAASSLVLMWE